MHAYRHALAALFAVLLSASSAAAQAIPAGKYPGHLIVQPNGDQEISVTVTQEIALRRVEIVHAGTGAAFGETTGAGLYQDGATVALTATPGLNTSFSGWSGDAACSGTPFVITGNLRCIATFSTTPALTLTIVHAGTGSGTTSPVPGTTTRTAGAAISLSHSAAGGSTFSSWDPHPCAEPSFAMPAVSLTCTAAFTLNPTAFNVNLLTVGSGTVAGAGSYLPGVTVHLTKSPAAGFVFSGWSPSPCADDFVMPSSSVTCTATFTAIPPPTGAGTWVKLNTGTGADPQPKSGGFQPWAYHPTTGDIWFYNNATAGLVYRFNHGTLRWTLTTNTNVAGPAHNCGLALVPDNDAMYMGGCAPNFGQNGSWVISTASGSLGVMTYRETEAFARGADALCVFDRTAKVILCLGGWSGVTSLVEKAVVPFTGLGSWTVKNPTGTKPVLGADDGVGANEFTRTTYNRGGWSLALGKLWVVDAAGDFFTYTRGTNSWAKTTMGGIKPPSSTMYAYHDATNTIVGVSACVEGGAGTCDGGGQTYLGNPGTATWSLGPGPAQGPTKGQYWATNILYNEARQTVQYTAHNSSLPPLWEYTPATTPPDPPAQSFTFGVTSTGSGGGTLGGSGTFLSGTIVTATAVPNVTSQFDGWVEAQCPTFALTADATCTARLNVKQVVSTGPYPDLATLPLKTLVPVACGPRTAQGVAIYDQSPWPCDGAAKHQRWAADGQGNVWTGFGDTNPSHHSTNPAQNQGYKLRVSDGTWSRWNAACRPAGQIQPSYPDELAWAYDTRGAFWLLGGVVQGTDGAICNSGGGESGATLFKTGLFKYTVATDRWERFPTVGGTNALWGHFDNVTKSLMYIGGGGTGACSSALFKVNVDTLAVSTLNVCLSTNPPPGTPSGTFEYYPDLRDHAWAFDSVGRTAYILGYHQPYVGGNPSGQIVKHLWAVNVDTGQITRKADPPDSAAAGGRVPDTQDVVFDTVNRRVIVPATPNHCGVLSGMYSYNPVTNTWESHSLTPSSAVPGGFVRANSAVYDPANNVVVMGGTVFCSDWGVPGLPPITHWFLWRYGP